MIEVTKLNHSTIVINAELIELIEETPDTIITMTTGRKILVKESTEVIIDRVIQYKKKLNTLDLNLLSQEDDPCDS